MSRITRVPPVVYLVVAGVLLLSTTLAAQSPHVRRITLDDAQALAAASKAAQLAQLGVDAAKYHRQAVQADYFPKIDSMFTNLHFNKFMGQTVQVAPRLSSFLGVPTPTANLPLIGKDLTIVAVTLTQPVTPILKINQVVNIAKADEAIARAKAAQSATQVASNVERIYFALLIAQRQKISAEIKTQMTERPVLVEVSKELITARSRVAELTQSLNALLSLEPDTELELTPPDPVLETISERQATQQALANSSEIVEAEQTVVKARAATKLSKLEYVPDAAVIGGYINQNAIPILPQDFSYIGVMASLTLFDFGKREKTIRERKTQLEMAEAGVDLVKAKVAASAQKAFLDLERTRRIRDLTRQLSNTYQTTLVSYPESELKARADRAKAEEDMLQAEFDYRLAYSQLKQVMEGR